MCPNNIPWERNGREQVKWIQNKKSLNKISVVLTGFGVNSSNSFLYDSIHTYLAVLFISVSCTVTSLSLYFHASFPSFAVIILTVLAFIM